MRRRNRLSYGLTELASACGLFYVTLVSMANRTPTELSAGLISIRSLTFIALIYFMVRALDNIGEGLKPYPIWEARWDKAFPRA